MPTWNVSISHEFWDDLSNLPSHVSARVTRSMDRMFENPWSPELHPEKVQRAEPGVHSCRADDTYRIIWKHIKPTDIIFCLVDKHDIAYRRASRKSFSLEDGIVKVADIVDIGAKTPDATGKGLFNWKRKEEERFGSLFVGYTDKEILDFGVPQDILPNIRALDDINQMDSIERLLPESVYDRLLEIVLGIIERPVIPDEKLSASLEQYQGGDDLYRFVNSEEFHRALEGDMEDWMLFLAPTQKHLAFREYAGPARVKGVSGSGKTVVAVHRVRQLAKKASEQKKFVLFLTYGNRLPGVISYLLTKLAGDNSPELNFIECTTIHHWCARFLEDCGITLNVNFELQRKALVEALNEERVNYSTPSLWKRSIDFFADEIRYVIKGRIVGNLDQYLSLDRTGRGTPLQSQERKAMYAVYEAYEKKLEESNLCDFDDFIIMALRHVEAGKLDDRYIAAVVDEIQDLTEATMKLIRAIVPSDQNDLFLVGDGLQRIYAGGYSLSKTGIDVVGRGTLLRRNYRNTQEILRAAHTMIQDCRFDDLDEEESEVIEPEYSVRNGTIPRLVGFHSEEEELNWVKNEINSLIQSQGYKQEDIALLYRNRIPYQGLILKKFPPDFQLAELSKDPFTYFGPSLKHTTFHSAKGLEFKVVFVLAVTDGRFVPRDDWTLEDRALVEYLAREQRLLYVAMTRARDLLYLSYSRGQSSRFLNTVPSSYLKRSQH